MAGSFKRMATLRRRIRAGGALAPYQRCQCGMCRECLDNARWDRVFARFEVKVYWDEKGIFQSTLRDI